MRHRLTEDQVALIERRVAAGERQRAIAKSVGVTQPTVGIIARGKHYHQQSAEEQRRRDQRPSGRRQVSSYLPTPGEIARHCARFLSESPRDPVGYMPFEWHGPLFPA